MLKILLLEDDVMIASGVKYALETEDYEVEHAANVSSAKELIRGNDFSLAIVDLQLPDGNGFEVNSILAEKSVPVIFLTVINDENQIVKAFDEGAEDYIVKPFRIRELLARVKRTMEHSSGQSSKLITIGNTRIDIEAGKVYADGKLVELTALEYRVLMIFATNRGVLLSRSQILDKIWDIDGNFVEDNTLTVYIKRIREKLGDSISIETIRGMGYRVD
ncbi:MAG: response regulator transcription factor [Lachnospiraceae bacterium]|nr:response regulator transcription factor [Lachnospiraceae bacterium]